MKTIKIVNGTILNPGEEFSYNKVVGPRTTARGFKAAAIFALIYFGII